MDVTIYTTPTCPWCKKTKQFFDDNDVDYEEQDVASDSEAAEEMIEKSGQRGVPVTVISEDDSEDETVVVGFKQEELGELLGVE